MPKLKDVPVGTQFMSYGALYEKAADGSPPYINNLRVKKFEEDGSYEFVFMDKEFNVIEEATITTASETPVTQESTLTPLQQRMASQSRRILDLLLRKNRDYGSSVFMSPEFAPEMSPESAVRVRLGDKTARIRNLLASSNASVVSESVDDTIDDMIGYLILWRVIREAGTELESLLKLSE